MIKLLYNEPVKKYFSGTVDGYMAYSVLYAMQQPIRSGERYLLIDSYGEITEQINEYDDIDHFIHVSRLRLPDRWQNRECVICGGKESVHLQPCDPHVRKA